MDWLAAIRARAVPAAGEVALAAPPLLAVLLVAGFALAYAPAWRVLRLGVTLVHELGHAVVGVAAGRQFTGFVLRGDMSGHAVTRGPVRGLGRVLSTWAGYPMPAIVAAATVWLAARGWSAPVVTFSLVVLLLALVRVRSALTLAVMLVALAATGALWWWRDDTTQPLVLACVGLVLLVGGWRHLWAVLHDHGRASDPGVIASLTHVPRLVWNASFVVVNALATWVVAVEVAHVVSALR